ncbi:MAG: VanW family protein [Pseudomonadota bacterium]
MRPPALPDRFGALWFEFRAGGFRCLRFARNLFDRTHRRHRAGSRLREAPVIAESISALWPGKDAGDDAPAENALVLGKIENLRIARRAFDGIELSRGEVLSFWAQLGRPSRGRGFAIGRELREGCLIPNIGGGLCQLSNALYDAALKAGLEVIERHAHSQVIPGSAAARDRDATVFWNYVDLRLRAPFDLRFEVLLDAESLTVRVRGAMPAVPAIPVSGRTIDARLESPVGALPSQPPGDCATCGQHACFRNAPTLRDAQGKVAILVQAPMPEHAQFLATEVADGERIGANASLSMRMRAKILAIEHRLRRSPSARRAAAMSKLAANAAAARLRPEHLELYVDQAWLPYLWRSGALAGRRYHVLMRALPMACIHAQLDAAAAHHPDEPSLRDFRADDALLRAEREALAGAERWIGPHAGMLALAGDKAHALPWRLPTVDPAGAQRRSGPMRLYFPASSLMRKGARELSAAMSGLGAEIVLPMRDGGEPARWNGIALQRIDDVDAALSLCDAVVLPAWVEHEPRVLIAAIARGIPVIATAACGLGDLHGWSEVPAGDVAMLRAALKRVQDTLF